MEQEVVRGKRKKKEDGVQFRVSILKDSAILLFLYVRNCA